MGSRLLLVAVLVLGVAGTAAASTTTPRDTYRAAIIAAGAKKSVHYVSVSNLGGAKETMVGDAALDRGSQRITYSQGGKTGHVVVLVVASTAYVKGDSFALSDYLGLTAAQASRYAGKWFSLKPPGGGYAVVAEAVRMQSFLEELLMPAPYTVAPPVTIGGKRATGVKSTVTRSGETATLLLYVVSGSPLPVAQVAHGSSGTITTTLSRWNAPVTVTAPRGAVAFH
jgi:hypothetical protein